MPNVLISELDASPALVGTDQLLVQHAAGPPAENCTMTQVSAFVLATSFALTGQTTSTTVGIAGAAAALPSTPYGYLNTTINGIAVKLPFYIP